MGNPGNMRYKTVHKRRVKLYRHSRDNNRRGESDTVQKAKEGGGRR